MLPSFATLSKPPHSGFHPVVVRPPTPEDRSAIASLIGRISTFTANEKVEAMELVDTSLSGRDADYELLIADDGHGICGYCCFGPTPMTDGTFDLYWLATDERVRGLGFGLRLVESMEELLRSRGGRLLRAETSSTEMYEGTRRFYDRVKLHVAARLADFYRPGDDLLILMKRL